MATPRAERSVLIVASILPYPAASGGQLRTLRLVEAIEAAGARPHLLTTAGGREEDAEKLRRRGWRVELYDEPAGAGRRLRQHAARRPSRFVEAVAGRVRELLAEGAAFTQFENAQNAYYVDAASRRPTVLSTHNVDAELIASEAATTPRWSLERVRLRARAAAMATTERRAARACNAVLCVSEHDASVFRSLGAESVLLVPNGVDDELFEVGAPPGRGELLFFGLLSYRPNEVGIRRFLIEAWPELLRRSPGARLRIAGGGATPELEEAVARSEGVELLGRVPRIADELARADVVLAPIWQGGGTRLKVIESLAAARPVVGTPLGVERIGFEGGRHGLVADDSIELAVGAAELLASPARAVEMGAAGRELAGRYRWSRVLEPARELYSRWLSGSDPVRAG